MRFLVFNEFRLGVLMGEQVFDVTDLVDEADVGDGGPLHALISQERAPAVLESDAARLIEGTTGIPLSQVMLRCPLPRPGKIVGIPVNYVSHGTEMGVSLDLSMAGLGVFLKANSSVIGPGQAIRIPYLDRRTDQEAELGFVVGRKACHVAAAEALDYVFGYTCMLDITVRGDEDRSLRKSYDTFTPIGPHVVTSNEITELDNMSLSCWVNDELRQDDNTRNMLYGIASIVEFITATMTLYPGDVVTTGTPAGVSSLTDGDRISVEIGPLGRLDVTVSDKDAIRYADRPGLALQEQGA